MKPQLSTLSTARHAAPTVSNGLLDRRAVCALFGNINPSTLYRHIKQGRLLKPIHIGGSSRWLRSECEFALQTMIDGRAR
jgi:predicted DNA-binding transcriptional regulator AlpA